MIGTTSSTVAATAQEITTTTFPGPVHHIWGEAGGYGNPDAGLDWEIVVGRPEEIPDGQFMDDEQANKLVAVLVDVTNVGSIAFDISPVYFTLQDTDYFMYDFGVTLQDSKQELPPMKVDIGQKISGYVVFEIPEESVPLAVFCDPSMGMYDSQITWSD